MAKFTKLPYSVSTSKSQVAFDLIHMDIWEPYRVPTHGQFRYFLTIVDDFNRSTWVYLLKFKSQALGTMEQFMHLIFTQLQGKIKIVRSDNALEFDSGPCQLYSGKNVIIHQTSCIDRPQQNGRVERKHRHVLEMATGKPIEISSQSALELLG